MPTIVAQVLVGDITCATAVASPGFAAWQKCQNYLLLTVL
jgi:hypothetical protein